MDSNDSQNRQNFELPRPRTGRKTSSKQSSMRSNVKTCQQRATAQVEIQGYFKGESQGAHKLKKSTRQLHRLAYYTSRQYPILAPGSPGTFLLPILLSHLQVGLTAKECAFYASESNALRQSQSELPVRRPQFKRDTKLSLDSLESVPRAVGIGY